MRPGKKAIFDELRGNLEPAEFVILADYRGMNFEHMSDLRKRLRKVDSRMQVVKNSIFSRVVEDLGWQLNDAALDGPTMMITGGTDIALVARTVKDFAKDTDLSTVRGGVLGAKPLSGDQVNAMADLPSREIMLGMFVGTVAAPMSQLVGVLNQKALTLLYVLKAVADKKSGE